MVVAQDPRVDLNTEAFGNAHRDVHRTDSLVLRQSPPFFKNGAAGIREIAFIDVPKLRDPVLRDSLRPAVVTRPDFITIALRKEMKREVSADFRESFRHGWLQGYAFR